MTNITADNGTPVTGLIPAAGRATRLGSLPYSKELLPVPRQRNIVDEPGVQLAIESSVRFLLECGVREQHIVIAPSKQDIRAYLGDGGQLGASVSYTEIANSPSVPHSVDAAFDRISGGDVILAFPDIMFEPRAAIAKFIGSGALNEIDVLLALVPSSRGDKVDMVSTDPGGRVREIVAKPGGQQDGWTWVAAAWSSRFSAFLHRFVGEAAFARGKKAGPELYMGDVVRAAIAAGLEVQAEKFARGWAIDIGTPDDFAAAWRRPPPGSAHDQEV